MNPSLAISLGRYHWILAILASLLTLWFCRKKRIARRRELALQERLEMLQAIIDNTTALIYVKDLEGRLILFNEPFLAIGRMKKEEILGKTDHEFLPKKIADMFREHDLQVIRSGKPIEFEEVVPSPSGMITGLSFKFPLFKPNGEIFAMGGISTDITPRKNLERELKAAKEELERRFQERTEELDNSQRRLRNLTVYLETVREEIDELKALEQDLRIKHRHLEKEVVEISDRERSRIGQDLHDNLSQHLFGISARMVLLERGLHEENSSQLQVSQEIAVEIRKLISKTRKFSQSLFPISLDKEDFPSVLQGLADQVQHLFGATLVFNENIKSDLSPEKTIHLYRIIQEAIGNSIRHGYANRIEVSLRKEGGKTKLEVRDDGIGIPDQPKKGDGMGLHIMEYRSKLIGGGIEIRRHEEGGTAVICYY